MPGLRLAAVLVLGLVALVLAGLVEGKGKRAVSADRYARGVNDCLDMTLEVGSEWRTANRQFTWQEMHVEVARRLKVKRTEPWNR